MGFRHENNNKECISLATARKILWNQWALRQIRFDSLFSLVYSKIERLNRYLVAVEHAHKSQDVEVVGSQSWSSVVVETIVVQVGDGLPEPEVLRATGAVQIECVELEDPELHSLAFELNDLHSDGLLEVFDVSSVKAVGSTGSNGESLEHRSAFKLVVSHGSVIQILHVKVRIMQHDRVRVRELVR